MTVNPILMKELKVKMRSWKAVMLMLVYLGVLSLVALATIMQSNSRLGSSIMNNSKEIYITLCVVQFLCIVLLAPILTSGSISGERERQTLDLLLCTRLRPISIVLAKLFSSLSQILLLIIASIPIFSVVFLFGGVSSQNLFQMILMCLVTAIMLGSIGVFVSTCIKKTSVANIVTILIVVAMTLGTLVFSAFYVNIFRVNWNPKDTFFLMYSNPGIGFASLVVNQIGMGYGPMFPGVNFNYTQGGIQTWHINLCFDIVLSTILIVLASLKLNPVKKARVKKVRVKNTN